MGIRAVAFGCALALAACSIAKVVPSGGIANDSKAPGAAAFVHKVLYRFHGGRDGISSHTGVVELNGRLYGTTQYGGFDGSSNCRAFHYNSYTAPPGCGVIFSVDPATGSERVSYRFAGGTDGCQPSSGLTVRDGKVYGATFYNDCASKTGCGTIFSFDPRSGREHVLHRFQGGADGCASYSTPVFLAEKLYGTTAGGGSDVGPGCGTVFEIDPSSGTERTVYAFVAGKDGYPQGHSLVAAGNALYGVVTGSAFSNFCFGDETKNGAIYRIDPVTNSEQTVYSFHEGPRISPEYADIASLNGSLYGASVFPLAGNRCGVEFAFEPSSDRGRTLHRFGCDAASDAGTRPDDSGPASFDGLIIGSAFGGSTACSPGCGVVFGIDPSSGAARVLYGFQGGADGESPQGRLLASDGRIYGTTQIGGDVRCTYDGLSGCGTVFELTPSPSKRYKSHQLNASTPR